MNWFNPNLNETMKTVSMDLLKGSFQLKNQEGIREFQSITNLPFLSQETLTVHIIKLLLTCLFQETCLSLLYSYYSHFFNSRSKYIKVGENQGNITLSSARNSVMQVDVNSQSSAHSKIGIKLSFPNVKADSLRKGFKTDSLPRLFLFYYTRRQCRADAGRCSQVGVQPTCLLCYKYIICIREMLFSSRTGRRLSQTSQLPWTRGRISMQ